MFLCCNWDHVALCVRQSLGSSLFVLAEIWDSCWYTVKNKKSA